MELLSTSESITQLVNDAPLDELRDALIAAQATISAAQARFAQALAVFRARDGHTIGSGFPTFNHWATVDLGLPARQTTALADAGDTAQACPALRESWEAGELSSAKAADALSVATPATDETWRTLALETLLQPAHPDRAHLATQPSRQRRRRRRRRSHEGPTASTRGAHRRVVSQPK